MLAIFPEFNWKTESLTPHVNPATYVSELDGVPFSVDYGGVDSWTHTLTALLTQEQKVELDDFWSSNRGITFHLRWCIDDETYQASFAAQPVCIPAGARWQTRVVLNRWPDLDDSFGSGTAEEPELPPGESMNRVDADGNTRITADFDTRIHV
jgi:hypothetical protein